MGGMAPGGLPLMAPSAAPTGDAGPWGAAGGQAAGGHRGLHGYAGEKRRRQRREPKQSFGSFLRSPFAGGGNRREGERERKLSRSLKKPSAIPSFHQRAWQKLALGVTAKNRFGIHLIFDSRQQLCLSPNCIWAEGPVQGPLAHSAPRSVASSGLEEALGPRPILPPLQGAARVGQDPRQCSERGKPHRHPSPWSLPALEHPSCPRAQPGTGAKQPP